MDSFKKTNFFSYDLISCYVGLILGTFLGIKLFKKKISLEIKENENEVEENEDLYYIEKDLFNQSNSSSLVEENENNNELNYLQCGICLGN